MLAVSLVLVAIGAEIALRQGGPAWLVFLVTLGVGWVAFVTYVALGVDARGWVVGVIVQGTVLAAPASFLLVRWPPTPCETEEVAKCNCATFPLGVAPGRLARRAMARYSCADRDGLSGLATTGGANVGEGPRHRIGYPYAAALAEGA